MLYSKMPSHFINGFYPATSIRSPPESVRQGQTGALDPDKNVRMP